MSIKFFGKSDINQHGNISSEVPSWAMTSMIEELQESIRSKKAGIEMGTIPHDGITMAREEMKKEEAMLDKILSSKPKFSEQEENMIFKTHKEMASKIQETQYTRSEMKLGLVDIHEEARRMSEPIIKITKEQADICKDNNIRVTEERGGLCVTRDGATQLWKLIGRYFGEPTNVETLRKDKATARTGA